MSPSLSFSHFTFHFDYCRCRTLDKKENDDDGIPDTSVVCCAESWDECCEVDSLIVAVIVLCLLGAMGFAGPSISFIDLAHSILLH